eukprot:Pgem_evm1s15272
MFQILNSLKQLDAACDETFDRIKNRVSSYQQQLSQINQRIDVAKDLVKKTEGNNNHVVN